MSKALLSSGSTLSSSIIDRVSANLICTALSIGALNARKAVTVVGVAKQKGSQLLGTFLDLLQHV